MVTGLATWPNPVQKFKRHWTGAGDVLPDRHLHSADMKSRHTGNERLSEDSFSAKADSRIVLQLSLIRMTVDRRRVDRDHYEGHCDYDRDADAEFEVFRLHVLATSFPFKFLARYRLPASHCFR